MIITLAVGILILIIFYYLISLVPEPKLQQILKVVVAIVFLVWLIGLLTGHNYLLRHL